MAFSREGAVVPLYATRLQDSDLRQIRVLTFDPDSTHEDAMCLWMLEVPLDEDVVLYDALSYTWGNPTSELCRNNPWLTEAAPIWDYTSQKIMVNGQELTVTANLFYALKRLRPRFQHNYSRYLWVDAICINQADPIEKAEEVKIMGDIYKQAVEVLVWLGAEEGGTDSEMAIDLLQCIYHSFSAFVEDNEEASSLVERIIQEGQDLQLDRRMASTGVPANEITGIQMKQFRLQTLWIERSDLHRLDAVDISRESSGKLSHVARWEKTMSWANATAVMGLISNYDNTTGKTKVLPKGEARSFFESSQPSEASILGIGGAHQNLFEVVRTSSSRACSEPKDKIYGVLGTMSKQDAGYIHMLPLVDYQATSYQELYTEFARFYLEEQEDLRILQCVSCHPRHTAGLPSWAPDWNKPQFGNMLPIRAYDAAKGQPEAIIGYRSEAKEMVIYGVVIDQVRLLAPLVHAHLSAIQAMNETQLLALARNYTKLFACLWLSSRDGDYREHLDGKWLDLLQALNWDGPYITGQSYAEAYWRTLIGDMNPYPLAHVFSLRAPSDLSISNMAEVWLEQRPLPSDFYPQEPADRVRRAQYFYPVSARVQATTLGKHLYVTHQGFMGLGTHNAEEGDIVVVFPGCQVPMLLRKREHQEYYTLVGETYVHGFMDGKAMEMLEEGVTLTEFNIR